MKLTVASQRVAVPVDATIEIERTSPALNDDNGSFSYPFPVPTAANQQLLGWPGRLQRIGDIAAQTFILEDGGIQVFTGVVEYDTVTKEEIGILLKSGPTAFRSAMEGKKIASLDFGYESWLNEPYNETEVNFKLSVWDAANTTSNNMYVVAPMLLSYDVGGTTNNVIANRVNAATGNLVYTPGETCVYMLQFRATWLLATIFEKAGYTVTENELTSSEFSGLVVFSRPLTINYTIPYMGIPGLAVEGILYYNLLMPDMLILDYVDAIAAQLCMYYVIDDRLKTVKILFRKSLFAAGNVSGLVAEELAGWVHSEKTMPGGSTLAYKSQASDLDTRSDYLTEEDVTSLPTPTAEGQVVHHTGYDNDYIAEFEGETLVWHEIGRLKANVEGTGTLKIELDLKIPSMTVHAEYDFPIPYLAADALNRGYSFAAPTDNIFSLWHGRVTIGGVGIPFVCADRWAIGDGWAQGFTTYLAPEYLYTQVYSDFLDWKAYTARGFTKYLMLSLQQVMAMEFETRYVINGIEVILDKVNFELPHYGIVKLEGFTV